ncbi:MAG: hypothetical protein U0235_05530 [Polyangiaceae bacterium]
MTQLLSRRRPAGGACAFALLPFIVLLVACDKPTATTTAPAPSASGTTSIVATPPATPSASASASTAPAASGSAAPAAVKKHPATCEVEVFGKVELPKGTKGDPFVYVAQDDCLNEKAAMLGREKIKADGSFFIEVFAKWGTDITICAAVERPDGTSELYGQATNAAAESAGKFHAEDIGEVTFEKVTVPLKKGPAKKLARPTK